MNHIFNQTAHGKVFLCRSCKKIHVEFNNINFNFSKEEYLHFSKYINELNGDYWEKINTHSSYRRKILIPLDHRNYNLLLNKEELAELKILLSERATNTLNFNLLSFQMIGLKTFSN